MKTVLPFLFIIIFIVSGNFLKGTINQYQTDIKLLNSTNKTLTTNITKLNKQIKTLQKKQKQIIKSNTQQNKNIFLQQRKREVLFLSRIRLKQQVINSFYHIYKINKKNIYKEVMFFNTRGKEIYKKSSIQILKTNVSKKKYFAKIKKLKEGQIYVSSVEKYKNNSVIRVITPIFRRFKKVGYLMGVVDYTFLQKIKKVKNEIKK